jgi:hypothetical protein
MVITWAFGNAAFPGSSPPALANPNAAMFGSVAGASHSTCQWPSAATVPGTPPRCEAAPGSLGTAAAPFQVRTLGIGNAPLLRVTRVPSAVRDREGAP